MLLLVNEGGKPWQHWAATVVRTVFSLGKAYGLLRQ